MPELNLRRSIEYKEVLAPHCNVCGHRLSGRTYECWCGEWQWNANFDSCALLEDRDELRRSVIEECAQVCNGDPSFGWIAGRMQAHMRDGQIDEEWAQVMLIPGRIRESIRAIDDPETLKRIRDITFKKF